MTGQLPRPTKEKSGRPFDLPAMNFADFSVKNMNRNHEGAIYTLLLLQTR